MPDQALLDQLDEAIAALFRLRAALAASQPAEGNGAEADDLAPSNLIDTTSAASRFNHPRGTIARWAGEGCGVKQGGRWLVSIPRLQRRLNGK